MTAFDRRRFLASLSALLPAAAVAKGSVPLTSMIAPKPPPVALDETNDDDPLNVAFASALWRVCLACDDLRCAHGDRWGDVQEAREANALAYALHWHASGVTAECVAEEPNALRHTYHEGNRANGGSRPRRSIYDAERRLVVAMYEALDAGIATTLGHCRGNGYNPATCVYCTGADACVFQLWFWLNLLEQSRGGYRDVMVLRRERASLTRRLAWQTENGGDGGDDSGDLLPHTEVALWDAEASRVRTLDELIAWEGRGRKPK